MRGTDRRKEILRRLEEEGSLSVGTLAEDYGISKMTAHRDLVLLEERGVLRRIHGGAVSIGRGSGGAGRDLAEQGRGECLICYRPATQHLIYRITLRDGQQREACCPHCGVSAHLALGDQITMALTADYLSGQMHTAHSSVFLYGSAAVPCCRPSILAFADDGNARRFQAGFGGTLGRLEDAINFLQDEMTFNPDGSSCPTCAAVASARDRESSSS
jgi:hypothetical protein